MTRRVDVSRCVISQGIFTVYEEVVSVICSVLAIYNDIQWDVVAQFSMLSHLTEYLLLSCRVPLECRDSCITDMHHQK